MRKSWFLAGIVVILLLSSIWFFGIRNKGPKPVPKPNQVKVELRRDETGTWSLMTLISELPVTLKVTPCSGVLGQKAELYLREKFDEVSFQADCFSDKQELKTALAASNPDVDFH
jgi:hypothetical protein